MTSARYSEETLVRPVDNAEVYGSDDFGWYTDQRTAETTSYAWRNGRNPLFKHLIGARRDNLLRSGFVAKAEGRA